MYKVIFVPAIGNNAQFEKEFETKEAAEIALDAIANYTLMLHECSFMDDYSNYGAVLTLDDEGDWVELDD